MLQLRIPTSDYSVGDFKELLGFSHGEHAGSNLRSHDSQFSYIIIQSGNG